MISATAPVTAAAASCYLCGSVRLRPALDGAPALTRCSDCGFVYDAPAEASRAGGTHERFDGSGGYRSYFERERQWRHEARRRLRWLLAHGWPERLLEVGSAGGFFVHEARRRGIDARGVELSPVAASHARRELHVPVEAGAFEQAHPTGPFDAVCAFHVLEHVGDPYAVLKKAFSLLGPGGMLALEVPNIESARARAAGASWFALQPGQHVWHFAPATLVRLAELAGFGIERCDTVFPHAYTRPSRLAGRFALASLLHALRATRSPRATHPSQGDFVRLLGRRPR